MRKRNYAKLAGAAGAVALTGALLNPLPVDASPIISQACDFVGLQSTGSRICVETTYNLQLDGTGFNDQKIAVYVFDCGSHVGADPLVNTTYVRILNADGTIKWGATSPGIPDARDDSDQVCEQTWLDGGAAVPVNSNTMKTKYVGVAHFGYDYPVSITDTITRG